MDLAVTCSGNHRKNLLRRLRVKEATDVPPMLTYLETRSVRPPTIKDYQKRLQKFTAWMSQIGATAVNEVELDWCLVEFMNEMFEKGEGNRHRREDSCRTSVLLPASRKTCFGNTTSKCEGPEGVDGGRTAAAATSAANRGAGRHLDGVDCQGQARARTEALCAVPDVSSPGECSTLKVKQLVPPQPGGGGRFQSWAILLSPMEDAVPGKTGCSTQQ